MKFPLRILIIPFFFLFFSYNISYADINTINKALNKNFISTSEVLFDPSISPTKTNLKIQQKNTFKLPLNNQTARSSKNVFDNSPTIFKKLKIKVNGKEHIIHVPFLNEKFLKKQKFQSMPKRISGKINLRSKSAPIRIGDESTDITLMPCPFKYFNFPTNETDELKIQAIADVKSVFEKVNSLTWENYGQTMQEIYKLTYEKIFPKYNKYPDLCMITRLYLAESSFKMSPQYYTSGTYLAHAFDQINIDYDYLTGSNINVKKVLDVINQRKLQMKENNKRLESEIKSQLSSIEDLKQSIKNSLSIVYSNNNSNDIARHIERIATNNSYIANAYNLIYTNYMAMGEPNKAHEIFNFVISDDGNLKISGKFIENYNKIPYEVPFLYYTYNQNGVINGTKEIKVQQYKNADDLLTIMKRYCLGETQNVKNQDFTDNTNLFEDKVINHMCKFVEDFQPNESGVQPTTENPTGIAKETIDKAKLQEYHDYAYGWKAYSGTETYYKNKPAITKLYFSRIENVELTSEDIPSPTERITLRADVDYNLPAPLYDFKIEINSSISDRTKTVIMKKCQYGSSAYYAYFNPNETTDPKDEIKNLINNEKDSQKESVSCFMAESCNGPLNIYNNKYFKCKLGSSDKTISPDDPLPADFINSTSFFKSAGAECIVATSSNSMETKALIRNQANWLIYLGHGSFDGSIGEQVTYSNNPIIATPSQDKNLTYDVIASHNGNITIPRTVSVTPLINADGYSEYAEDLDVIILAACDALGTRKAIKAWNKTFNGKDKVILGYRNHVRLLYINQILNKLNKELYKNITKPELCELWLKINKEYASGSITSFWITTYYAAFIHQGTYFYSRFYDISGPLSHYVQVRENMLYTSYFFIDETEESEDEIE